MDLGEYLFHRAQHAIPALWAMHSLHHSDRGMNVLTVQRHFWLESAIKAVTIWPAVALLFRPDGPILLAYYLITLNNLVTHANLRLGYGPLTWLINSPQYHRLHHSADPAHHNANFAAVLPIFDVVSGAYRRPARGEFPETGLNVAVEGPLDLLLWPVRGLVFPARGRAA
jgi:sterol desaturase/sphingolipid hydroxylase (fatty acid hydroxylase superfamily)